MYERGRLSVGPLTSHAMQAPITQYKPMFIGSDSDDEH